MPTGSSTAVCERGTADFVVEIAAELPLLVIAELLGVPQEDRRMVFDWSNQMIGAEDPEYQVTDAEPGEAAMQVYSYAEDLASQRRLTPRQDLVSVLIDAEVEGEKLNELELDLFFLLLIVAGNETTRNLMSGAMTAFFDHPEQWELLRQDRSLLPNAVEEMLRYVTPVMHFRRTATTDMEVRGQEIKQGDKIVFWHTSANRDEDAFDDPDTFDVTRSPNNHIAFGGGGPHFCLGANLARMEIMVMFDRVLDRIPDIRLDGEVQRLQSNFINGTKHIPVAFDAFRPRRGHAAARPGALRIPMAERTVRFHQSVAFLPTSQLLPLARACDELGYGGDEHLGPPVQPASPRVALHLLEARGRRTRLGDRHAVARLDCQHRGHGRVDDRTCSSRRRSTWHRPVTSSAWPGRSAPRRCSRATGYAWESASAGARRSST